MHISEHRTSNYGVYSKINGRL